MSNFELDNNCRFISEEEALPGVRRVADLVRRDIKLVTGHRPGEWKTGKPCSSLVIYGTLGHSPIIDQLEKEGRLDLSRVRGKWEVYSFTIVDNPIKGVSRALVVAGSDKRGTIYGLFHISELIGVSPLVDWNHVMPVKRDKVVIKSGDQVVSKEPSVKYRGFFINDEWPAFGNWAVKHFGGVNARCYKCVFEMLLRLKGNYLWPAMWSTNFSMDGPGIESARLADEYGIVMSTSHHEPCMRSGEEYTLLRGKDSIYGDAWNFRSNEDGITRFWRDGLLRNRDFENVITVGMRGERDTAILGREATLEENIQLLRDVLKTQNKLMRECVNPDLEQVPRQFVMFTEIESFFYGNEEVHGLYDEPELDGVTVVIGDDNFGYSRTLPPRELRDRKGGWGMYYHQDMHGGAYSYQWIGSTYLPRLFEQMTQAYEYGVREIWVTNIGDIGTQEYGLSYFLDLAYDIDKWGGTDAGVTLRYTDEWVRRQFSSAFGRKELSTISDIVMTYTQMLERRKHEVMTADTYHPLHYGEAQDLLMNCEKIINACEKLYAKCSEEHKSAFVSLLYYPACATANLMRLWIYAGRNHLYALQNRMEANDIAELMKFCIEEDKRYTAVYRQVDKGYYAGFELSEHIGFTNWNDEDCKKPVMHYVFPADSPRMLISRTTDENYTTGLEWCDRRQEWRDALRPDVDTIAFDIFNGSDQPFRYKITTDCPWLSFIRTSGKVRTSDRILLYIDKSRLRGRETGEFYVEADYGARAVIKVTADNRAVIPGAFIEDNGIISINASHFDRKEDTASGRFEILEPYGKESQGIKAFPVTTDFTDDTERPYTEYRFVTEEEGDYTVTFMLAPTTPVTYMGEQNIGYSVNGGQVICHNTVRDTEHPFFMSFQYCQEARTNIKLADVRVHLDEGVNMLRYYAMSPNMVLEKIVMVRDGVRLPESYLGPVESYIKHSC